MQVGAEEGKPHKEEDFKYKYTKNRNTEKIVHKKYMHAEVQWKGGRTKRENHVLASIQEDHKRSYKRSHKKIIHTCKHI